jgi:tRNA 2-thiocytidine biosynthesis protein TtcA
MAEDEAESSGVAGRGCEILVPFSERGELPQIERSLITKYRKKIWSKFIKAVKEFSLVEDGDRIAVAVSGGKDSTLMAKLFQELQRHGQANFELEFIAMDPGYHPNIRELLTDNCRYLEIPIHLFDSPIFQVADKIAGDYPCYLCARMRRGALYAKAKELGCNKLALGHHFDDVIETILLNIFYTGCFKTMLPKLKSTNFEGIELIRPLYYIGEEDIADFIGESGIWPLNCACMVAAETKANKRYEIKDLIKELKKKIKNVDQMIMTSGKNVNLNCIAGWRKDGVRHSYLEYYDE